MSPLVAASVRVIQSACASQRIALTLASQVQGLFPISLNLTTLEIITWNCPCLQRLLNSDDKSIRSVPPGSA